MSHQIRICRPENIEEALKWCDETHSPEYIRKCKNPHFFLPSETRAINLPLTSKNVVKRFLFDVSGTLLTVKEAIKHGIACNLGGGTHHAKKNMGSGFSLFNDLVIAARFALNSNSHIRKVVIVDADVHQGDGTASLCQSLNQVYTTSFHCEANYPFKKEQSDMDISFPQGTTNEGYLAAFMPIVHQVIEQERPDLVLYLAGVDVHKNDYLGKLKLSDAGIAIRDRYIIELCLKQKIPIACVIGGGYDENLPRLVARHSIVIRQAANALINKQKLVNIS